MDGYPISRWVNYWAEVRGDLPVIEFENTTITWSELGSRMERGARTLSSLGVHKGDRVGILLSNRPEYYEIFFAIARLGAIFIPVNPRLSPAEVTYLVEDSGMRVLFTESSLVDGAVRTLEGIDCKVIDIESTKSPWFDVATQDSTEELVAPDFHDTLAILYTSGTTGRAKGAVLTHAAFFYSAENLVHAYSYGQEDRHLVVLPLSFTGGILTLSQPVFVSGGTIVLERQFDPDRVLQVFGEKKVTVFFAAPALLQLLRIRPDFSPDYFSTLRLIVVGAAPVPAPLLDFYQNLGISVGQGYALTEGGGVDTFVLTRDASRKLGTVGTSCMFTEVRVIDEADQIVPTGTTGEIVLRGPNMMKEYWNNPDATAAAFSNGWLRTGDLGVMDEEGFITVVDRLKDMVITGGMNVYPAEVEAAIVRHDSVAEVAVVGVPHEVYGETVIAVVVLRPDRELSLTELRDFLADTLADYKMPRRLVIFDVIPRNASLKVQKFVLREQILAGVGKEL